MCFSNQIWQKDRKAYLCRILSSFIDMYVYFFNWTLQFKLHDKRSSKTNLFQTGIPIGNPKIHKWGDSPVFEIDFVFSIWYPLWEHSYMTSDVFGAFLTYLSTYPNQILYYISLCSKIRCSLTYLSTYPKIWRHIWMLP